MALTKVKGAVWDFDDQYKVGEAADADATPSVEELSVLVTANTGATTITGMDDGYEGQVVLLIINDANTTIDFTSSNMKGQKRVDYPARSGDAFICILRNSEWYCSLIDTTTGVQNLSGAGAVNLTDEITHITTTGTDALTLADGYTHQRKFCVMIVDGGTGTLTPTNLGNGTTITFDDVGDSADLLFTNGNWYFMGGTATLA